MFHVILCGLFVGATSAIVLTIQLEAEYTRQDMQESAESMVNDRVRDVVDAASDPSA